MLLLLSSGARPRYREDIIRSLALPKGLELQFRYDVAIVDPEVVSAAKSGKLNNEKVLACYIWTQAKGAQTEMVPCRLGTVSAAEVVGSSLILRLRMLTYVEPNSVDFQKLLDAKDLSRTPQWTQAGASEFDLKGLFALRIVDPKLTGSESTEAFEATVRKLCTFADFSRENGRNFYRVVGLKPVEGAERARPIGLGATSAYELEAGMGYDLEIYTFLPEGGPIDSIERASLQVQSESKTLQFPMGSDRAIDSGYDIKRFRLALPDQLFGSQAPLNILVVPSAQNKTPQSDILLPLQIKGNWRRGAFRALLISAGTALPAMIAAAAADKLTFGAGFLMIVAAMVGGFGTVFLGERKS